MVLNPSFLQKHYTPAGYSIDTIDGAKQYKVLLVSKDQNTHLLRLHAWIDAAQWIIRKVETTPYEGRILTLQFEYALVEGKYWLLSKTVASFGSAAGTHGQVEIVEMKKQALDDTPKPPARNGIVTIRYSNYKINQKIDDSVFEKKEVQGKK
jgi:outer membrane lipoprotein-sorting protein